MSVFFVKGKIRQKRCRKIGKYALVGRPNTTLAPTSLCRVPSVRNNIVRSRGNGLDRAT